MSELPKMKECCHWAFIEMDWNFCPDCGMAKDPLVNFKPVTMSETTKSVDTPITKLRNKLTPYFNLVALVKDQSPRGSLVSQAKICDNLEIKSLLEEIESYANSRAVEALKEAQLESKKTLQ